ncbi:MAG: hypothetical protein GY861_18990 [bacterium]|nr:hypothetical protein [bacterium]
MANDLTNVIPQLLAQGLITLRENAVMPRLVNTDYEDIAKNKGQTVDIPIPTAVSAQAVTAANTPPSTDDDTPGTIAITLDQWYEAPFYLTDNDMKKAMDGYIPMQAAEAIKAIANNMDSAILNLYSQVPYTVGTGGTTPFGADVSAATDAKKKLSDNLTPNTDRRYVMNTTTEANALLLRPFQDMSWSGSAEGIAEGKINRKLGFDWHMDQNMPTHTTGTQDGAYLVDSASVAIGDKTVNIDAGTGTYLVGDTFTVAGDTQEYVVTADELTGGNDVELAFLPAAKVAWANSAAITFVGNASTADTWDMDLAFHRDAFAFVSRPLADIQGLGNLMMSVVDEVTGVAIRLEVSREHKRTRFSYDVLYGVKCIRPELAVRVLGA